MAEDAFGKYLSEINEAYLRNDATEHTHRPALKKLIEALGDKITATNEPRQIACGAPDILVSKRKRKLDFRIGYIECKDIGKDLKKEEKTEQVKKRYLPSLHNFILTDYINFRWYTNGELRLTATIAREGEGGAFKATEAGKGEVKELLRSFLEHEPEKVASAKELAVRMGHMARMLRDVTHKTFSGEQGEGPLHRQLEAFREVLIHDLSEEQFADMYAQTICYGVFTARCHCDESREFVREQVAYQLPKTNPFLRKMFNHIAGPDLDDRIAWLVDDVVALLRNAKMDSVLRDFMRRKGRQDPVVHFYETFLAEYDSKMRKKRGVYYTPGEVVSYIVRSVDWLLREKFGVKRGLADESKVKTEKGDVHKVLILDPAVGTGTFLFEVIDLIHGRFKKQKGMWSGYVREHLLPRLFGFELMMAPYAIAHMKLGLELAETGYDFESDERLGIYLTNTLEEAEEISRNVFVQWLSEEAAEANKIKKNLPIMVVTGNPPYAGLSANMNDWIEQLLKKKLPGENGAQSYYEIDGQPLGEKKVWLQDDYVKFIRFGQLRIEQSGYGILAFITNHGYLDNLTFRGMRQSLMQTFDEIYIVNLHGNSKRGEICPDGSKDVNVFDIQQGVGIGIFLRTGRGVGGAKVHYADLYGLREGKYQWLVENEVRSTEWTELSPNSPYYFFVKRDESSRREYERGWKVDEVFLENNVGMVTSRDKLTVQFTARDVWDIVNAFVGMECGDAREKYGLRKDAQSWQVESAQEDLKTGGLSKNKITAVCYRPFDKRYTYYTGRSGGFISRPVHKIMQHMLGERNVGLCWTRSMSPNYEFSVEATRCLIDQCSVGNKSAGAGISYIGPLYLYPATVQANMDYEKWPAGRDGRIPNLSREFIEKLGKRIKLEFVSDGRGDLKDTFGPEDVFHYIYGVFHSPEYRRRYAEFLKIDFPRVPWPKGKPIFRKICKVGEQLVKLHLMEAGVLEVADKRVFFDIEGTGLVEKGYPKYVARGDRTQKGKVYINKDQYFEGVKPEVWEFHIGGYQVCERWLKYRRGRELSYDDVRHYQKIVVALGETIRLMGEPCLSEMFEDKES